MDVAGTFRRVIDWIGDGTGASDALLHVHAGLAVLLLARMVTGRSLASPVPFAAVCAAAVAKEVFDRMYFGSWRWWDTSFDMVNTLFWPLVLMIGLRLRRLRSGPHAAPPASLAGAAEDGPAPPGSRP